MEMCPELNSMKMNFSEVNKEDHCNEVWLSGSVVYVIK